MLYDQLKRGIVTRETATVEKKKLLHNYRIYKFNDQMGKEWVDAVRKTEAARAEYRKNRTLENADKLVAALEGAKS